ncbi:lantibiotic dehydratase [Flavobacterium sp. 17A]|uniref:Lantibiotic dehydratase n=1 Tax=Flavobacterium potami TaxID=2872310 RepID=A0A9X1H7Q4_9FLAO|nr:thiopeptide-type bacteriocin biosynthesis protein [Flavobacterium potami]MBZ4034263.1 lantibiotic dehydratase [Flavobacterium potami]
MIFFDNIIKRVANFSVQSYDLNKNNLPDFFNKSELFNLCLLTASGSLYHALNKNKEEKTAHSLSNYFLRAHFNPTPFGVFNSVGTLKWGDKTSIVKGDSLFVTVKYDNYFISSKLIEKADERWKDTTYCMNPTVHFINDEKIGFYKSKNKLNDKIDLHYIEIDCDDDLRWLLDQFSNPVTMLKVIDDLISQNFDQLEVETFLKEITETGLIIDCYLFESYASKLNASHPFFVSDLIEKREHFMGSDESIRTFAKSYIKEQNDLFKDIDWPRNFYAINSFDTNSGSLDFNLQDRIRKYIDFTVQYNSHTTIVNDNINKFIGKLSEKYNDGFIALNDIFNPYSGIDYTKLKEDKELKLHQDIVIKILSSKNNELFLNLPVDKNIDIKASKLPASFNIIFEKLICKKSGESIIHVLGLGDPSALNIISRFSDVTEDASQDIIEYEKEVHKGKIIADIKCMGSFRSINVAPQKQRYDYCIPINSSYDEKSNPILQSDLFIHLNGKNISLVSKKLQKEILPKKVSAVNQKLFDSSVYNFLCDFEFYNQEIYGINANFNLYRHSVPYVPRIYLEKGILIHPAQILLVYDNFTLEEFKTYLLEKIEAHCFSQKIVIIDRQRNLILDTENGDNLFFLFEKLKEEKYFYVSECLYENFDPLISRGEENFAHELIVGIKNSHFLRPNTDYKDVEIKEIISDNATFISDWLYLEVFCNIHSDSEIFKAIENKIILEDKADQFFFVNYFNPDRHLRLRFKTKSTESKQYIIGVIHDLKLRNIIGKYHVLPYNQELHRYGGRKIMEFSEEIFDLDSRNFLTDIANNDLSEEESQICAILKIKNYLNFLGFSLEQMIVFCENAVKNYSNEFELTSELRKDFNRDFAVLKFKINSYNFSNFLTDYIFKEDTFSENDKKIDVEAYAWLIIHMSMNRHFQENQRFMEFKMYYFAKAYFNQLKFKR